MTSKKIYLETLRIISILCVIFNHTWTSGYLLFTQKLHSPLYPFYILVALLCKVAIPIFLMISGSLLLEKQDSIRTLFKKRISRIVLALLASSVLYYAVFQYPNYSSTEFLRKMYSSEIVPSQWYLYAYLGILLILPFLQRMVPHLKPIHFYYLMALHLLVLGILPIVQYFIDPSLTLHRYLQMPLATPLTVFYFLFGYFVDRQEKLLEKKALAFIGGLAAVSLIINTLVIMKHVDMVGVSNLNEVQRFQNVLFLFPTIFTFLIVKKFHLVVSLPDTVKKGLTYLGSLTFGIYLIERILWVHTKVVFWKLNTVLPTLLACFAWVFAAFLVGVVIIGLLKKVPGLNKII